MERLVAQTIDCQGRSVTRSCFRDPLPLTSGKSSRALWACALEWPSLRDHGFGGICISHYTWDRACYSSLRTMAIRRHILESRDADGGVAGLSALTN
eukprot:15465814-Alexandrium_andersonii.AAC.1